MSFQICWLFLFILNLFILFLFTDDDYSLYYKHTYPKATTECINHVFHIFGKMEPHNYENRINIHN